MTMKPFRTPLLLTLLLLSTTPLITTSQKFDPYALNGGLIAAVAGRDYVLIASDTRLTDGGYGVRSRCYLSGRLWSASSSTTATTARADGGVGVGVAMTADVGENSLVSSSSSSDVSNGDDTATIITPSNHHYTNNNHDLVQQAPLAITTNNNVHWDSDGSLILPSITTDITSSSSLSSLQHLEPTSNHPSITTITTNPPIIIGSAGCASDCESLKRRVRLELDALHMNSSYSSSYNSNNQQQQLGVASVANLLQQILYSRRGFPFYSFCVVAGLHPPDDNEGGMEGAVYVYDAIGSYERVAVGSSGTGRELLQPILDQLFSENGGTTRATASNHDDNDIARDQSIANHNNENHSNNGNSGDILAIPPMKQRVGVAGSLRPPVRTTVRCTLEDAVRNVARAYQSVAEREISVGDEVVICVVRSTGSNVASSSSLGGDGGMRTEGAVLKVYRYPLKKH